MKLLYIVLCALLMVSASVHADTKGQDSFDFKYSGDLSGLVPKLCQIDPRMKVIPIGAARDIPLSLRLIAASKVEILRTVGELAGDKADLVYSPTANTLKIAYKETPRSNSARMQNPDGSVVVAYGSTRPELTCQALDPCAIELEAGEQVNRLDVGQPDRWEISPALVGEGDRRAVVLVVRPTALMLRTKLLLITNRRIYSIGLSSPAKDTDPTDSRLYFTYPQTTKG